MEDPFENELFQDHMIFSSLPNTPELEKPAPAIHPRRHHTTTATHQETDQDDGGVDGEEDKDDMEVEQGEGGVIFKSHSKANFTAQWLQENYELREGVSIPRSLLFGQYLDNCQQQSVEPVNAATFGKIIRAVWPSVATRRLGTRGNSKYHYYGITLKRGKCISAAAAPPIRFVPIPPPIPRKNQTRRMRLDHQHQQQRFSLLSTNIPSLTTTSTNSSSRKEFNNEAFLVALANICTPNSQALPPQIPFDAVCQFASVYQQHLLHLQQAAMSLEFLQELFWGGIPTDIVSVLECDEVLRIVIAADDHFYSVLLETLVPNVMEPLPTYANQTIRSFSKSYLSSLANLLDASPTPTNLITAKLDIARPFVHCLRRKTTINHLAQAVHALLLSQDQVTAMVTDWLSIDLDALREQLATLLPELANASMYEGLLQWVSEAVRLQLTSSVPLPQWSLWLDSLLDQLVSHSSTNLDTPINDPEAIYRDVLLKWSLFSQLFIRDLTLRSASSFGSFHLFNLLCQEYIMHSVEHRLDEQRRWLTIFPNNAMHGFASNETMDTLFSSTASASNNASFAQSTILAQLSNNINQSSNNAFNILSPSFSEEQLAMFKNYY